MARFGEAEIVGGQRDVVAMDAPDSRGVASLAARLGKKGPDLRGARRAAAIKLAGKLGLPVYESNYSRLIVQVASPRDFPDANGRVRTLPGIRAKFNFGLYTPTSALRKGTKEHSEEIKLIQEAMESHPKYGLNLLFWRADEMQRVEREVKYKEAVDLLNADEELRSRFLAALTGEELDASVVKTQAKRRDIIADARGKEEFRPVRPVKSQEALAAERASREEIMERAERSRDKLAQKVREAANEGMEEAATGTDFIPRKKKKKKHRPPLD